MPLIQKNLTISFGRRDIAKDVSLHLAAMSMYVLKHLLINRSIVNAQHTGMTMHV